MTPRTVTRGSERNGVNRYARTVAAHLPAGDVGRAHVHFTDRLWGRTPEEAAGRFARFAATTPCTVTLHDAPQPSDGAGNLPRRAAAYGRVAAAARAVACSSTHEAALLRRHSGATAHVIPHYVERLCAGGPIGLRDDTVAVLGFVYPGKGHAEVIDAAAALTPVPGVLVLGGPAPGHAPDVDRLRRRAATAGVALTVTGYLDDAALGPRLGRAGVPVAAHRHVSASGSVATWIAAGRRPLVPDGPYARELAPGSVIGYTDLAAALAAARRDPASTWRAPGLDPGPDPAATARAYLDWWDGVRW